MRLVSVALIFQGECWPYLLAYCREYLANVRFSSEGAATFNGRWRKLSVCGVIMFKTPDILNCDSKSASIVHQR